MLEMIGIEKFEMVDNKARQKVRRVAERRSRERRKIQFKFGSAEWRRIIQQEYLLWPKKDRRDSDRRAIARRKMLRRVGKTGEHQKAVKPKDLSTLLSSEEKEMLNKLNRSEYVD